MVDSESESKSEIDAEEREKESEGGGAMNEAVLPRSFFVLFRT